MTAAFAIRPAIEADLEQLPAIEYSAAEAFRQVPDLEWVAEHGEMGVEQHRELMRSGKVWVADDEEGIPVAFLSCEILTDQMHIWELAVHADAQRAGLGRRMVQTAIDHGRKIGLRNITFTTFRDVAFNAPFYEQLGFRILEPENLDAWLRGILDDEAKSGLPRDRRCAMEIRL